MLKTNPVIHISDLVNKIGGKVVHNGLNLKINQGEIVAIIGASGCGKTTLLRSILMLRDYDAGIIKVFGQDIGSATQLEKDAVRSRWGVMFQSGALFGALTVAENIKFLMHERAKISHRLQRELVSLKLSLVGLEQDVAGKYPAELSGGMKKRAAVARAIAMDPELLFLDEPTAGLDPTSASDLDQMVLELRDRLGLTIVMVTHDLDTLVRVPDKIVFLGEGKVLAFAPMKDLLQHENQLIRAYFSSKRAADRV